MHFFRCQDFSLSISAVKFLGRVFLEMRLIKENRSIRWRKGEREERVRDSDREREKDKDKTMEKESYMEFL